MFAHRSLTAFCLALCLATGSLAAAANRLIVQGGTLLTIKPGEEEPFVGYLVIGADGRIAAVRKGGVPAGVTATETIDVTGKIVIPGFISAHSHIWQSAFRGLAPYDYVRNWVTATRSQSNFGSAEDFYWFTLHGSLDHLRHGITSAYNFTQGNRDPAYEQLQLKAELDSGLRVVHAWARSGQTSSAPGTPVLGPAEVRKQLTEFITFAEPYRNSPLLLKFSISGVALSQETVSLDYALVKEFGLVNQTHFLEYPRDTEEQRAHFRFFVEAGALGPTLYFGHFIHTNDAMLEAVGKAGGGMSWNPLSNGRLASGLADIPRYIRFGVKIGMGVDGQASADLPDPFENMRMGLYGIRAKYESATILKPIDVLRFHTLGSATVMNVADKVGSLEAGKFGDFLIINPASVDRAPVYDPYATLVFACNTQNLEGVYVGGELVSSYCKLTKADFANVQKEMHERVNKIRAAHQVALTTQ
ncbi:MAG: hydroxydechloroatrazine ethylaminohydrolase [Verrucomicrobia bacterium]|nr:hydroxydechloroatrazine ethylaminohydrolase [Verrucomicrobiota bacterium]